MMAIRVKVIANKVMIRLPCQAATASDREAIQNPFHAATGGPIVRDEGAVGNILPEHLNTCPLPVRGLAPAATETDFTEQHPKICLSRM